MAVERRTLPVTVGTSQGKIKPTSAVMANQLVGLHYGLRGFRVVPYGGLPSFARRMGTRETDGGFGVDILPREESSSQRPPADVIPPPAFVSATSRFVATKDSHPRTHLKLREQAFAEKHQKVERRPEYTSLADVYEKSLRNVLNIQLQLTLDDQIPERCSRSSPPHPRVDPYRDYKRGSGPGTDSLRHHRVEEEQRLVTTGFPLQGRTQLRNSRKITSSEGSAFHVPSKRQSSEVRNNCKRLGVERFALPPPPVEYPLYSGAAAYPGNRVGSTRGNEFAYGTQDMYLTSSQTYLDHWHKGGRSRDVPLLFPVRCTPLEQRTERTRTKEFDFEEIRRNSRKQEQADSWRANGVRDFGSEANKHIKPADKKPAIVERDAVPVVEKRTQDKVEKKDRPRDAELKLEKNSGKIERAPTPPSTRFTPYTLKPKRNTSPVNGIAEFKMSTRYRSALRRIESRKEARRSAGQEGQKEEFLSKLGLEKVEHWH